MTMLYPDLCYNKLCFKGQHCTLFNFIFFCVSLKDAEIQLV